MEKLGKWLDDRFPHGSPNGECGKLRVTTGETRKMPVTNHESSRARTIANAKTAG